MSVHQQSISSETLTSCSDEHVHVLCCPSERTAYKEEADGDKHGGTPTERVREATGQGQDGGTGQPIRGTDPDEFVTSMEGLCDRREGDRDSSKVEGTDECADKNGDEGKPEGGALAEAGGWGGCGEI